MNINQLRIGQVVVDRKINQQYLVVKGISSEMTDEGFNTYNLLCSSCHFPTSAIAICEIAPVNAGKIYYCLDCAGVQDLEIESYNADPQFSEHKIIIFACDESKGQLFGCEFESDEIPKLETIDDFIDTEFSDLSNHIPNNIIIINNIIDEIITIIEQKE